MKDIKVLAICGSLRKDSLNRKALLVAKKMATDFGAQVSEIDLKDLDLPIYDGDIEAVGLPDSVLQIKKDVEDSDILLIASPEYNYSISGALKNTIDWLSRGGNSLNNKSAVIFGASPGALGTVRGQFHLRQILEALNVFVLPQPQVFIKNAKEAFDDEGNLKDEKLKEKLSNLIKKTIDFKKKVL
jgi:chromate reductase, NAD(P)H dehydrogenase (quinone)